MIFDHLDNIWLYKNLTPTLSCAIEYLEKNDLNILSLGRHEIDSDRIYASVNEYETKDAEEIEWEAHKKYIDIQILLFGEEKIGYTHLDHLIVTKEYNSEKDIVFFSGEGEYLTLKPGYFAIFFPHDAHRPGLISEQKIKVKKVVVKVESI